VDADPISDIEPERILTFRDTGVREGLSQ